tara:strand:+ start:4024 stop:4539 length:516 start_codon:yes stop_codon:yes gene_type:complete
VKLNSLSPQNTNLSINKIDNEDVISLVDETIIKNKQEKIEGKNFIDSLGILIYRKGEQIKKSNHKLYINKEELELIKYEKIKLEKERNNLKKCYEKLNNTIEILGETKKETQIKYDSLKNVNKKLKEQLTLIKYNYKTISIEDTIYIQDTIFIKDTIYLTKKQKKRVLNKK